MIGILIGIVLLYLPAFKQMAAVWTSSEDFSHGWLIAPISIWLIWRNRHVWMPLPFRPSPYGFVLIILFGTIWVIGSLVGANVLKSFAAVGFLLGGMLLVSGWPIFKANLFPLLFLFAMVPAGHALVPMLMEYTADATVFALRVTGLPVYRENLQFILPTGRWSVVEACSGLRYVIAATVLGLLFAYLNYESWIKRAILCISCLVIAIFANWARAFTVVLVGHYSEMRYGTGDDHVWFGWLFFGIVMSTIFWIGLKFGDKAAEPTTPVAGGAKTMSGFSAKAYALLLVSFLALLAVRYLPDQLQVKNDVRFSSDELASKLKSIDFAVLQEGSVIPLKFEDGRAQAALSSPYGTTLWVAYYARQQEGGEMLSHTNLSIKDKLPTATLREQMQLKVSKDGAVDETRLLIGNQEHVFWRWFFIDKHQTSNPYWAKFWRLVSQLSSRGDHSFVVVLSRPVLGNIEEQRKTLGKAKANVERQLDLLTDSIHAARQ